MYNHLAISHTHCYFYRYQLLLTCSRKCQLLCGSAPLPHSSLLKFASLLLCSVTPRIACSGPTSHVLTKTKEVRGLQTRLRLTPTTFHQGYKVLRIAISCTGKLLLSHFSQVHLCHLRNHWNHFHPPIYHSWCACFCSQTSLVSNTT